MTDIPAIVDLGARDAQFWLDAANASVRDFCGWHVAPVITQTLRIDGSGSRTLLLPSQRVVRVVRCLNDGVDITDQIHVSERNGILERSSGLWSARLGGVQLVLEHGHVSVPGVAGVIAALAARGASMPAGVVQQSVGPASVRYGTIPLLAEEKTTLEPYRLTWGS